MFLKKLLPIVLILSVLTGGFSQPSFATQNLKAISNNQRARADITVCFVGCDYSSIQAAIDNADPNDNILLADEIFTESITVYKDLNILGEGANSTVIQAAVSPPLSDRRVITVTQGSAVTIQGVTIRHGSAEGIGIEGMGGGILNQGGLTLIESLLTNNAADNGGALANTPSSGQAIAMISHTTIDENTAAIDGGGIYNFSSQVGVTAILTLTNSTLTTNQAEAGGVGGGIANISTQGNAYLTVQNATISGNSVEGSGGGGGIHNEGSNAETNITQATLNANSGGNLYIVSGSTTLTQSILANVPGSSQDCTGTVTDGGFNLVEDGSCGFPAGGDPLLDVLADNGGSTPTHALLVGSPAIDAVPTAQCASNLDQRDVPRPFSLGCDIGAFELDEFDLLFQQKVNKINVMPGQMITFTVTTTPIGTGVTNGTISGDIPEELSIQYPILLDPPGAGTVGTAPPILVYALEISPNQTVTMTMFAEVALGLPEGITLDNIIWFTSTEIITSVVTTVTLNIINSPPIALDDSGPGYFTTSDQPFVTGNVLDNDSDPNGDELILLGVDDSNLEGTLVNNLDGTFTYDPDGQFDNLPPGFTAYETFTYGISDGKGGISSATVTIAIQNPSSVVYLPLIANED